MKATRYFVEQVLRKRPYIKQAWCERVISNPMAKHVQPDGRIRFWGAIAEEGGKMMRVVTLSDGQTVHNAFFDRNYPASAEGGSI